MEVPDWVWDEARLKVKPSAFLLMLAIFRHGGGPNAESFPSEGIALRARVKATIRQLASMSGASTRAIDGAVEELQQHSYLVVSEAHKRSAARSFSIPYASPQCATSAHPTEPLPIRRASVAHQTAKSADPCATVAHPSDSSRAQANGGGVEDPFSFNHPVGLDSPPPTFSQVPREKLLRTLRALEVQRPATWLQSYGAHKVLGALAMLHEEMATTPLTNPAGRFVSILRAFPAFETVPDVGFLDELEAPRALAYEPRRRPNGVGGQRLEWVNRRKLELMTNERLPVGAAYERAASEWAEQAGD